MTYRLIGALVLLFGGILACGDAQVLSELCSQSVTAPIEQPTPEVSRMIAPTEVSAATRKMKKTAAKTRLASVEVHNLDRGVRGTGTYFLHDGHHIVLTAAHVVDGGAEVVMVSTPAGEPMPALILAFDNRGSHDYSALLLQEPLQTRTPMDLKVYSGDRDSLIGENVVYTGNPGHHKQLTIQGTVSGFANDGSIMLQSYAWGGASGSSVFDSRGNLVGILKSIDVNRNSLSPYPQLNENVVWLSPPSSVDLEGLTTILEIFTLMQELQGVEVR
jgi:S1-C subfamily serine protease